MQQRTIQYIRTLFHYKTLRKLHIRADWTENCNTVLTATRGILLTYL
jgi:hypothetical protein